MTYRQLGQGFNAREAASSYARTIRPEPKTDRHTRLDTLLAVFAVFAVVAVTLWR